MSRRVALVFSIVFVMSCSPSPSPVATQPPEQTPSPTLLGITLMITGGGQVSCPTPYGCRASLVIQADPTGASPESVWTVQPGQEISFPSVSTSSMSTWDVGAAPIEPPATIQPGRYRLAGVVNLDSDVVSPATTQVPAEVVPTCLGEVIVDDDLVSVMIDVQFFADGGCAIETGVGIN
jgi:hypothetical protein